MRHVVRKQNSSYSTSEGRNKSAHYDQHSAYSIAPDEMLSIIMLTLKAPVTSAADDNFLFFFLIFQTKQVSTSLVNCLLGRLFT